MHELVFYTYKDGQISEHKRVEHKGSYGLNLKSIPDGLVMIDTQNGGLHALNDWRITRLGFSYAYRLYQIDKTESILIRVNSRKGIVSAVSKSEIDLYNAALQMVIDDMLNFTERKEEYVTKMLETGVKGLVNSMKAEVVDKKFKLIKPRIMRSTPMPSLEDAI